MWMTRRGLSQNPAQINERNPRWNRKSAEKRGVAAAGAFKEQVEDRQGDLSTGHIPVKFSSSGCTFNERENPQINLYCSPGNLLRLGWKSSKNS